MDFEIFSGAKVPHLVARVPPLVDTVFNFLVLFKLDLKSCIG